MVMFAVAEATAWVSRQNSEDHTFGDEATYICKVSLGEVLPRLNYWNWLPGENYWLARVPGGGGCRPPQPPWLVRPWWRALKGVRVPRQFRTGKDANVPRDHWMNTFAWLPDCSGPLPASCLHSVRIPLDPHPPPPAVHIVNYLDPV